MTLEENLRRFIDVIREDGSQRGTWSLTGFRTPSGSPPLTVSLARFQSYRRRTEAALIQELADYIKEAGIEAINYQVLDNGLVLIW